MPKLRRFGGTLAVKALSVAMGQEETFAPPERNVGCSDRNGGGSVGITDQYAHLRAANTGVDDLAQGLVGEMGKRQRGEGLSRRRRYGRRRWCRALVCHEGRK
jgi:hypothetical protein